MKSSRTIIRRRLCFFCVVAFSVAAWGISLSPAEYRQQLEQLSSRIEQLSRNPESANAIAGDLPDRVIVQDNQREYSLSYEWLKTELQQFPQQGDAAGRAVVQQRIQQRLQLLLNEARSYGVTPGLPESHGKIDEILSRREFRRSHAPGLISAWWAQVIRGIARFFSRFPLGRSSEDLFHLLIYVAVIVAFIMLVVWIKRRLDRPLLDLSQAVVPLGPSARGWRTWLAEARSAAHQGAWRDAVHLAYWAGIAFLEEQGAWPPDRARTPREYVHILGTRKPQYPVLAALTRKFEVIWYGDAQAGANDFQETLGQLEKLGLK